MAEPIAVEEAQLHSPVPQAIEAEQRVIGIAMIDADAWREFAERLSGSDFFRPAHQTIVRAMLLLATRDEAITPLTVSDELERLHTPPPPKWGNWLAYTTDLVAKAVQGGIGVWTVDPVFEADLIRRTSLQRALIDAAAKIAARAYGDGSPVDALEFARSLICTIQERFQLVKPVSAVPTKHHGQKSIYETYDR